MTRFYKFSYLFKFSGGGIAGVFFSKRSWDFYLSFVLTIVGYAVFAVYREHVSVLATVLTVSIPASGALLGLVLASYAIVSSLDDESMKAKLIESGYYQYAIFQFTWSGLFLLLSTLLGIVLLLIGDSFANLLPFVYPLQFFFFVYGVTGAFCSFFYALRHLAIMNGRGTEKLRLAWDNYEREVMKERLGKEKRE